MNASLDTEKTKLNWIEIVHQPYQKEQEQHFPFIDVANLAFPLYKTPDSLRTTGHRTGKKGETKVVYCCSSFLSSPPLCHGVLSL